jgi:hypothetical protein
VPPVATAFGIGKLGFHHFPISALGIRNIQVLQGITPYARGKRPETATGKKNHEKYDETFHHKTKLLLFLAKKPHVTDFSILTTHDSPLPHLAILSSEMSTGA